MKNKIIPIFNNIGNYIRSSDYDLILNYFETNYDTGNQNIYISRHINRYKFGFDLFIRK
jgi:hypothetical protein